jgi:distribution and morphology protein 31
LDSFHLEDALLTIYDVDNFRPYTVSIISAQLPQLRQHYLLYDFLCGHSIVGYLDNSLFTIHASQLYSRTDTSPARTKIRKSHFRLDGLNVDFVNGGEGMASWIKSGTVSVDVHYVFPTDMRDPVFHRVVESIAESIHVLYKRNGNGIVDKNLLRMFDKWKTFYDVRSADSESAETPGLFTFIPRINA